MGRVAAQAWCWWALALLLTLLAPAPAAAQAGVVGDPIPVCVRRAGPELGHAGLEARALLTGAHAFDCLTPQRAFGPGDYWVRSAPVSVGANWPARIRVNSLWQRSATLHALYADGAVATLAGDGRATSRRLRLGAIVEYRLPVRGVPVVRLLWRVEGAANMRGIVVAARSAQPADSVRSDLLLAGLYAGFAGLCLSLLVYNLAMWAALGHQFQRAYCVMVATLLVYATSSSGALAWIWPDIANNDRLRVNYVSLSLSAAAALAFARTFFEPRVFAGWIGHAAHVVTAALIGTSLLFVGTPSRHVRLFDLLYAGSFLLLVLIAGPILFRAWRRRSDYLWLFALAWAAPIALAAVRISANFGLVEPTFLIDNSTLVAMAIEAVMSSLAVTYRISLLSRERDDARAGETVARALADVDPLTGLLNRRAFLTRAIGREGRQALLVLDIDHFKRVNETIGHDGGDEVLRLVSRLLDRATPPGALAARLGGEEFAIVADAEAVAAGGALDPARLLEGLRAERMPFSLDVTASIGVAHGSLASEADWKRLYRAADQALFDAKACGRDRVRRALAAVA